MPVPHLFHRLSLDLSYLFQMDSDLVLMTPGSIVTHTVTVTSMETETPESALRRVTVSVTRGDMEVSVTTMLQKGNRSRIPRLAGRTLQDLCSLPLPILAGLGLRALQQPVLKPPLQLPLPRPLQRLFRPLFSLASIATSAPAVSFIPPLLLRPMLGRPPLLQPFLQQPPNP